jgi:hypothetical protein
MMLSRKPRKHLPALPTTQNLWVFATTIPTRFCFPLLTKNLYCIIITTTERTVGPRFDDGGFDRFERREQTFFEIENKNINKASSNMFNALHLNDLLFPGRLPNDTTKI